MTTTPARETGCERIGLAEPMEIRLRELELRNGELIEAHRRKDLFLATLSHELKNPVYSIRTGLELLGESRLNEASFAEWISLIEAELDAIATLVADLSDVARIAAGKVRLQWRDVPVRQVMKQAAESVRDVITSGRHRLTVNFPSSDINVTGDPQRLRQVFANLLGNAATYTPEGGEICFSGSLEAGEVAFRVRDNGIGITPEMLPHLFDLYYQEGPPGGSQSGLGLGLPIVRELVMRHGGTIDVSSRGRGQGSEFEVRLPAAVAGAAEAT
jgi:signal transduction histidine kinase